MIQELLIDRTILEKIKLQKLLIDGATMNYYSEDIPLKCCVVGNFLFFAFF